MRKEAEHEAFVQLQDGTRLTIRDMLAEDVSAVASLEAEIFSVPWSENAFLEEVNRGERLFIVVYVEEKLAGYCGLIPSYDEGDVCNVAVAPQMRRKGIAEKMLTALMRWGEEMGVSDFTLEVRKSNVSALSLYEKLGFVSEGIRKNFYEKPVEDAVIMWKRKEK